MTDPLTLGVASAALALAAAGLWLHRPVAPDLDAERWFKVMLATLLRGEIEAAGGDVGAWERAVVRFVPYHPAGRLPERKVAAPSLALLGPTVIPGERALIDALAALPDAPSRWARMYDTDEAALGARLDDPADLGPAYDPARWLGPDGGWDALAAWGGGDGGFRAAVTRRLGPARWVLVSGAPSAAPDVIGALAAELGDRAVAVPWRGAAPAEAATTLIDVLRDASAAAEDRVVVVAAAEGAHVALRALAEAPPLRDRVVAVVAIGGVLRGRPGDDGPYGTAAVDDFMGHVFTHAALDTEARRTTPYVAVQWLDRRAEPPGAFGLPLEAMRFPAPGDVLAASAIEAVDIGPLPADPELPTRQVARALVAFVAGWVASRG